MDRYRYVVDIWFIGEPRSITKNLSMATNPAQFLDDIFRMGFVMLLDTESTIDAVFDISIQKITRVIPIHQIKEIRLTKTLIEE